MNLICISERQLNMQNIDEVENTAIHEVTHILAKEHDSKFYSEELINKISNWKPPGGVVHIIPSTKSEKSSKRKQETKFYKNRCNQQGCNGRSGLEKCPHCRHVYCTKHFKPKLAAMFLGKGYDRSNNGHVCLKYYDFLKDKEKKEKRYTAKP